MLNRSASLAMSTSILKALPGKPDIKRHSPSIIFLFMLLALLLSALAIAWCCFFLSKNGLAMLMNIVICYNYSCKLRFEYVPVKCSLLVFNKT